MIMTQAYIRERRARAFGNTVHRCPTCGFEAFGAPVTYHELYNPTHLGMLPLEHFLDQWVETFAPGRQELFAS